MRAYTARGIAPSELLIMYVVESRIGTPSRHLSNSSIVLSLGMFSFAAFFFRAARPQKIAQSDYPQPRQSPINRDFHSRNPPRRDQRAENRQQPRHRSPGAAWRKPYRQFAPFASEFSSECQMRQKNNEPAEKSAEK